MIKKQKIFLYKYPAQEFRRQRSNGPTSRGFVRTLFVSTPFQNLTRCVFLVTELEVQSLRESDGKKKKKRHHPEKKKKKKHVHADDALASGGDSPATDSDKDSDDGKSRDGYSSPDTGNIGVHVGRLTLR